MTKSNKKGGEHFVPHRVHPPKPAANAGGQTPVRSSQKGFGRTPTGSAGRQANSRRNRSTGSGSNKNTKSNTNGPKTRQGGSNNNRVTAGRGGRSAAGNRAQGRGRVGQGRYGQGQRRYNHLVQLKRSDLPVLSPQMKQAKLLANDTRQKEQAITVYTGKSPAKNTLKIIPLGGLCEIGKNMTVIEYGNDMIIIDVGVAFPENDQPGIDSVIPDMSYVRNNRHKLRGIFLTHGHEDHIGSLSWLLRDLNCPVYGGRLTIELVSYKLEDKGVKGRDRFLHVIGDGETVKVGCFAIESIHVNHSIADAFSYAIHTPAGVLIHSGDFKIDYTPIHGKPIDLSRFASLGEEGVLLFMCESTNADRPGFSSSERSVGTAFTEHFSKAQGRIVVATFSSNIHRVQQVVTAAEHVNRKVALVGRSMLNVFKAANNLGYIDMRPDTLIDITEIHRFPPEKLVIITTGSQGEPLAGLTRMAFSEHRFVEINASDTVIISATPIPGNEKPIYKVINELYKLGANVVYSALADIHVSGHAYRDEMKILHQLVKPRYFVPIHGEYRHLYFHAGLAHEMGQPWESIFILNNGDILEFEKGKAAITGYTEARDVLIDGSPNSLIDDQILDQRLTLSDDGVISIAFAVDMKKQQLSGQPIIQSRGFIYRKDNKAMEAEISKRIENFVSRSKSSEQSLSAALSSNTLRNQLQGLLYSRTERRPVILLSVIEI